MGYEQPYQAPSYAQLITLRTVAFNGSPCELHQQTSCCVGGYCLAQFGATLEALRQDLRT
jgi:hypothetical protein